MITTLLWIGLGLIIGIAGTAAIYYSSDTSTYFLGKVVNKQFVASYWVSDTKKPDSWYFIVVANNQSKKIRVTKLVFDTYQINDNVIIDLC